MNANSQARLASWSKAHPKVIRVGAGLIIAGLAMQKLGQSIYKLGLGPPT
jgi:hypothetical protein